MKMYEIIIIWNFLNYQEAADSLCGVHKYEILLLHYNVLDVLKENEGQYTISFNNPVIYFEVMILGRIAWPCRILEP